MFKKAPKLSLLLLLAVFLFPAARLHAQSSDPTIVTGTDPQPTGEPKPNAGGGDSGDAVLLALEIAMLMALQVS